MVTLAEVAKAAGVSPSAVSHVLSGKRAISEPTRARVEQAIGQLDYHPHAGARAPARSTTTPCTSGSRTAGRRSRCTPTRSPTSARTPSTCS